MEWGGPGPGLRATGSDPRPSLGPIPHQKEEGAVESIVGGVGLWGRVTGPPLVEVPDPRVCMFVRIIFKVENLRQY